MVTQTDIRMKTLVVIGVMLIVILVILSTSFLFKTNKKNLAVNNEYSVSGSPLPNGYFYELCKNEGAVWDCQNTNENNANCCMCKNLNESLYYGIGCSSLSPKDLCLSSGGNWSVSTSIKPTIEKCICPLGYNYSKEGCKK